MSIEIIFSITSLILSIISVIAAVIAVRYTWYQAEYARKQYELTKTEFDLQIQKQKFSMKFMDSFYHYYKDRGYYIEFLGAIIGIDNPTQSSVFVRFINIRFNLRERYEAWLKLSFWQRLLIPRASAQLTISYPTDGWRNMSGFGAIPSNILSEDIPTVWLFDRRTDKLIGFSNPVEIPQGTNTVLWELIVGTSKTFWEKVNKENYELESMTVRTILHDESIEEVEVLFKPRLGLESSSRERVNKLISTSSLPKPFI